MKTVLFAGSALILSGCVSPEMTAAEDTRACIRMGAVAQGKMLECQLAQRDYRQREALHRRRALGELGRAMMTGGQTQRPRMNCSSSANIFGGYDTQCY